MDILILGLGLLFVLFVVLATIFVMREPKADKNVLVDTQTTLLTQELQQTKNTYENKLSAIEQELGLMREQNARLKEKNKKFEDEKLQDVASYEKIIELRKKNDAFEKQCADLSQEVSTAKSEVARQIAAFQASKADFETLKKENEGLKAEVSKENFKKESFQDALAAAQNEERGFKDKIADLEKELSSYKDQCATSKKRADEKEAFSVSLQETIDGLREAAGRIDKDLEAQKGAAALEQLQEEYARFKKDAEADRKDLEEDAASLKEDNKDLEKEILDIRLARDEMEEEMDRLLDAQKKLAQETESTRQALDRERRITEELKNKQADLRQDLEQLKAQKPAEPKAAGSADLTDEIQGDINSGLNDSLKKLETALKAQEDLIKKQADEKRRISDKGEIEEKWWRRFLLGQTPQRIWVSRDEFDVLIQEMEKKDELIRQLLEKENEQPPEDPIQPSKDK
ncbi:MAG: hypothetical protein HZB36_04965 [Candidatus Omnitrophica bacterium]|nr:hypothetical protein [Candidatus Omnitrophota bacterium]